MQEILNKLNEIKNYIELQDQLLKEKKVQDFLQVLEPDTSDKTAPTYWNSNQEPSLFNKSVLLIEECIKVASKYGGRVFGGYVRNVLIPHFYGLKSPGFKDVDLWFTSSEEALKFTLDMGNRLVYKSTNDVYGCHGKINYPFGRTQFMLNDNEGNQIIIVDVIVSDELPVNDLNVNQLTYSAIGYKSFGQDHTMTLIECIKNKTATKLPGYSVNEFDKINKDWSFQLERLQKMQDLGWVIHNISENEDDYYTHYWNSNQLPEVFKKSIVVIDDCIKVASKHGGRVFGGYVRNVLIPAIYNQPSPGFKDVDLWFTTHHNAAAFLIEMGYNMKKLCTTDQYNKKGKVVYPFDREQFMLLHNNANVVIVDIIISLTLPVNDLDVNQLTYSTHWEAFGKYRVESLQHQIMNKEAYALPGYSKIYYEKNDMDWTQQIPRLNKLCKMGWRIHQ